MKRLELFPISTQIEETPDGQHLTIAGCNLSELAEQYGTPLYLYDRATLDDAVEAYQTALERFYPGRTGLTYAGKAFLCLALAQWTQEYKLWVDCTGAGEISIAVAAGVPKEYIIVHGVNKSHADLNAAVTHSGTIVVDNLTELERLISMVENEKRGIPGLWLRFRPGLAVDTHSYRQTGQEDSKFGMDEAEIAQAAHICRKNNLPLKGLHFHQGSHFHDPAPVEFALERTLDLYEELYAGEDWSLCPGGGWGVAYHEDDLPHAEIEEYVRFVAQKLEMGCQRRGIALPRLHLEPGRSLVARAGVALYRVGVIKHTPHRRWLLLDGGMADNPRPALYAARYSALPVWAPERSPVGPVWLAGPYCESGDIMIEGLPFPNVQEGEVIAVPVSGAYHLSMASNYNGACRPAVLWLEDGTARLMQARETPEDLIRRDRGVRDLEPGFVLPIKSDAEGLELSGTEVNFSKYQALGNDYLVLDPARFPDGLSPEQVRVICDRHYGIGSDGILLGPFEDEESDFRLRLYNPDGGEFEKSGNGLRIFARYLWDNGLVSAQSFTISTPGGVVKALVYDEGKQVSVEMGRVSFNSRQIPVSGAEREVLNEVIVVDGQELTFCGATIGNPHCVIPRDEISPQETRKWGHLIETEARFPQRTNVQFMKVLDRSNIRIEIWERGVGYTLASGSSSCAAAAVAHRLGYCDSSVVVHMPGGDIDIVIDKDYAVSMSGRVSRVCEGLISGEVFDQGE